MSKTLAHVLIPYTTEVACGAPGHYRTPSYRDQITCKLCKKTEWYKKLPTLPRRYREKSK